MSMHFQTMIWRVTALINKGTKMRIYERVTALINKGTKMRIYERVTALINKGAKMRIQNLYYILSKNIIKIDYASEYWRSNF
jgi:hypothetical protein